MGDRNIALALEPFDRLYVQPNGESSLQQLQAQLANALPYDLEETKLSEYKNLEARWHNWESVKSACSNAANIIFDGDCGFEGGVRDAGSKKNKAL